VTVLQHEEIKDENTPGCYTTETEFTLPLMFAYSLMLLPRHVKIQNEQ
jgi:hypothetical protein